MEIMARDLMAILRRPNGIRKIQPLTTYEVQPYPTRIFGNDRLKKGRCGNGTRLTWN